MKWHLFRQDDPNTWPQIDCPMVVYYGDKVMSCVYFWDNDKHCFFDDRNIGNWNFKECYYSCITYVPSGYRTHKVLKCKDDSNCKIGCKDDGYCMYDFYECEQQVRINEYNIEEKAIWKEF